MPKRKNKALEKTKQAKLLSMHMAYPLSKMKPYKKNPRNHEDTIDLLVRSLGIFGAIAPIVLREDGTIAAGHARYKAAKKQGRKTFPAIKVKFKDEEAFIAYVMTDNQIATRSTWISAEFGELHDQLDASGWVPEDTGFDPDMIPAIRAADLGMDEKQRARADDVPAPPKKAKSRLGDLYILGDHRVLCGDATKLDAIERLMDGTKAHMIFTDPPYNVSYTGPKQRPVKKRKPIVNDALASGDYKAFCIAFAKHFGDVCDGCVYVCHSSGRDGRLLAGVLDEMAHLSTTLVWNKNTFVVGGGKYHAKWEPIWFGWTKSGRRFTKDRSLSNVWDFPRPTVSDLHPTMKPVALIEQAVRHASQRGHIVYDPFLGSGTTLIACEQLGRKCYGMEIEPIYIDVIVKRWENFTGLKAKRVRRKRG